MLRPGCFFFRKIALSFLFLGFWAATLVATPGAAEEGPGHTEACSRLVGNLAGLANLRALPGTKTAQRAPLATAAQPDPAASASGSDATDTSARLESAPSAKVRSRALVRSEAPEEVPTGTNDPDAFKGLESIPRNPQAEALFLEALWRACPQEKEKVKIAALLRGISPVDVSKVFRRMVLLSDGIPREFAEAMEAFAEGVNDEASLQAVRVRLMAEAAGEDYLPASEKLLVRTLAQVSAYSRTRLGARALIEPLVSFIRETKRSFKSLLSQINIVNRNQAELLVLFLEMQQLGIVDGDSPYAQEVFRQLAIHNVVTNTEPLPAETVYALRFLARLPLGTGWVGTAVAALDNVNPWSGSGRAPRGVMKEAQARDLQRRLARALDRTLEAEAKMNSEAADYGLRFVAYTKLLASLESLSQPDGQEALEMNSLLMEVVEDGLEDHGALRDFYLSVFNYRGRLSYRHPFFRDLITETGDIRETFNTLGGLQGDPVLSQVITSLDKMKRIHARVLRQAFLAEAQELETDLLARSTHAHVQAVHGKVEAAARTVLSSVKGADVLGVSAGALKTLGELFVFPSATATNAPTAASTEPITAADLAVPLNLPAFLAVHLNSSEAKRKLYAAAIAHAVKRASEEDKPFPDGDWGGSRNYLNLVLQALATRAGSIFQSDIALQRMAWNTPRHPAIPMDREDRLRERRRNLQLELIGVIAALRDCLISNGMSEAKAEEVATLILCRHLEAQPGLARLLMLPTLPALDPLGSELVLRAFQKRFGNYRRVAPAETAALATSTEEIARQSGVLRKETRWLAAKAVVISVLLATSPQWGPWVKTKTYDRWFPPPAPAPAPIQAPSEVAPTGSSEPLAVPDTSSEDLTPSDAAPEPEAR